MNKSKFKSVKFKPFDIELNSACRENMSGWTNYCYFGNAMVNDLFFTDSCIEAYPELFEVEKAEREFEEGAYYKARFASQSVPEMIQRYRGKFLRVGLNLLHSETDFHEIDEKIEL